MTLPDYFLADLPQDAPLTPSIITEACHTLRRNRQQFMASRTTAQSIELIVKVAEAWLDPENHFRNLALEQGPAKTCFGRATIERGIDSFFREVTAVNLEALLVQDLGSIDKLDVFSTSVSGLAGGKFSIATAPELLGHITAGNLPCSAFMSILLGVLLRSAQFVKCATGGSFFPLLLAHSIYAIDSKAASCIEVATWHGGNHPLERALIDQVDCLTATGSDEVISRIRLRVPAGTKFVAHGHKLSFAYISNQVGMGADWGRAVANVALDVTAWNQLGCLSPQVIYVQNGGAMDAEVFARELAAELERVEQTDPRGTLTTEGAAVIASRRSLYALRAANTENTRIWSSKGSTAWTVVYEADPRFQASCLNRFIYVKRSSGIEEVLREADAARKYVSTVGVAVGVNELKSVATALARWGVSRVCPIGKMQSPPFTWRHDGQLPLGELVTWTDCEQP